MADAENEEIPSGTEQMRSRKIMAELGVMPESRPERKAMRFNVAQCAMRLRRPGGEFSGIAEGVIDLSLTGVQCVSRHAFAKGEDVELELFVPAFKSPLYLVGKVCWVAPVEDGRRRIGIEFLESDKKTQMHLQALHEYESLRNAANFLSSDT